MQAQTSVKKRRKLSPKEIASKTLGILFKVFVSALFLFPFYWMLTTSLKPYLETLEFPPTLWPRDFTLSGYLTVFRELGILTYIKNTLLVTLTVIVIQTIVIVPAAYAFAKWNFKGKALLFGIVMAAFMVPGQITFISTYFMFADWGLLKTLWPQILPFCTNAFGIFLLRQNFMQVPEEIIESARLDNSSEWRIMWRIMIPMSRSTIITIALFTFIGRWNAYFWPLVMTKSDDLRPITLALERMKDLEQGLNYTNIMAGNMILVLPVLILFLLFSKKIIQAMAYRGMK